MARNKQRKLSRSERREWVRRLSAMGLSRRKIVEAFAKMGYSVGESTVTRDREAIVEELQCNIGEEAKINRTLDLEMLKLMLEANASGALNGLPGPTDHVLKVLDRRAKLYGYADLDIEPEKNDKPLAMPVGTPVEGPLEREDNQEET